MRPAFLTVSKLTVKLASSHSLECGEADKRGLFHIRPCQIQGDIQFLAYFGYLSRISPSFAFLAVLYHKFTQLSTKILQKTVCNAIGAAYFSLK